MYKRYIKSRLKSWVCLSLGGRAAGPIAIQLNNNIDQIQLELERMRISGVTQNSDISIIGDPNFFDVVFENNGNNDPNMA